MGFDNITDVPGIKVGHQQNEEALTGCTVILTEDGATAGVDVRGAAPGTRETDLLNPTNAVSEVNSIVLSGGSAFGLDASSGVMKFLEERGIGLDVGVAKVPVVPSAIIFDLAVGDGTVRPDYKMGFEAAQSATAGIFKQGNIGCGCGATVGKVMGFENCMKSGLGSASIELENGLTVGAIVAVNAFGDVRDPQTGTILAGAVHPETNEIIDSEKFISQNAETFGHIGQNTTIGAIAVNADLSKSECQKISQMTHNALARTIFPVHTMFDGDTIFTLATGGKKYSVNLIGILATQVMEEAIVRAVKNAQPVEGIPAYN